MNVIIDEFSELTEEQIEWLIERASKTKEGSKKSKTKSSRCKDTIDWFNVAYIIECKKEKKGESGY